MTGSEEAAIVAAEEARRAAIMREDADALAAGMADYFHYAHINGLVEDRETFLARMRAGTVRTLDTRAWDLAVVLRPGYAMMTGKSRIQFEWRDGSSKGVVETLFLANWEKHDGIWKIAAYASSPLPASR